MTLAVLDFLTKFRADFSEWYPQDAVSPLRSEDVLDPMGLSFGVLGYLSESGTVTTAQTDTLLGIIDNLDPVAGVGITQYRICFGRRERTKQINQGYHRGGRIVIAHGAPKGEMGKVGGAQKWSNAGIGTKANPRSLATLFESVSVYVWGYDHRAGFERSELAQYVAARELWNEVYRSFYRHARAGADANGLYPLNDPAWLIDHTEQGFGFEIEAMGVIQGQLPDHATDIIKGPPPTLHGRQHINQGS